MRKHSKFITILLSALLAVCLVQTVFVQAFATEMGDDDFGWGNASTSDEAETVYPVSMEVVKAPESVTVSESADTYITDSTFWSNVVLHIVYSNGEEYDVNCDGINSEGGIVPPIAEIDGYKGKICYGINSKMRIQSILRQYMSMPIPKSNYWLQRNFLPRKGRSTLYCKN